MTHMANAAGAAPFPGRMVPLRVWGFHCERCSHDWLPRMLDRPPRVCPRCKSPYWDRPRGNKARNKWVAGADGKWVQQ